MARCRIDSKYSVEVHGDFNIRTTEFVQDLILPCLGLVTGRREDNFANGLQCS